VARACFNEVAEYAQVPGDVADQVIKLL